MLGVIILIILKWLGGKGCDVVVMYIVIVTVALMKEAFYMWRRKVGKAANGACETRSSPFLIIITCSYLMSYSTLTVDEIVGKLTKAEVIACLPIGWIRARDSRNWRCLKELVAKLPEKLKTGVYNAARTKERLLKEKKLAGKKRKRLEHEWARRIRRRVNEGEWRDKEEGVCEINVI